MIFGLLEMCDVNCIEILLTEILAVFQNYYVGLLTSWLVVITRIEQSLRTNTNDVFVRVEE